MNKVKINNTEISIEEYNQLYFKEEHPIFVEYNKLYNVLFGSEDIEKKPADMGELEWRLSEYKKSGGTNPNLFADLRERVNKEIPTTGATSLREEDNLKTIERIVKDAETKFNKKKEFVELGKQLFEQRQKEPIPKPDQTREERNREATELQQYKESAIQEINNALVKEPQINNNELKNNVWQSNIEYSKKKEEIDRYKKEVLADISAKRVAKQENNKKPLAGQELKNFARDAIREIDTERDKDKNTDLYVTWEELEINNPDWRKKIMGAAEAGNEKEVRHIKVKVLVDLRFKRAQKEKSEDAWEKVKNDSVGEMNESQLAAAVQEFEKKEGKKGYKRGDKFQSVEDKLIERDPELYKKIVVEALRERLKNNGLSEEEFSKLNQDYLKLVNKEITEIDDFKRIKNELGKKIGEKGAEGKWVSLMSQANTLLTKAKKNVTEQIKKDLKTIQEQMKSFKSEVNSSYLSSYYQSNKTKVDKLERDLSVYSTSQTDSSKKTPWGTIIPVSLVVVALIGIVAVVIVRKRKQNRIKK